MNKILERLLTLSQGFPRIKDRLAHIRRIMSQASWLSVCHIITIAAPLIILPVLIRRLGLESYGTLVTYLAIANLSRVLVRFGFEITGVRDIASQPTDAGRQSVYSRIVNAQIYVFFVLFLLTYSLAIFATKIGVYIDLYLLGLALVWPLADLLQSAWYLHARGKAQVLTYANITSSLFLVSSIMLFVEDYSDLNVAFLSYVLSFILGGVFAKVYIRLTERIHLSLVPPRKTIELLKYNVRFFASRFCGVFNLEANVLLLALLSNQTNVATFDVIRKIVEAAKIPGNSLDTATIPILVQKKSYAVFKTIFVVRILLAAATTGALFWLSDDLVQFLGGDKMISASTGLEMASIVILLSSVSYYIGSAYLIPAGHDRHYNFSAYFASLIFLVFSVIFYFSVDDYNWLNAVLIYIFVEVFLMVHRSLGLRKGSDFV